MGRLVFVLARAFVFLAAAHDARFACYGRRRRWAAWALTVTVALAHALLTMHYYLGGR